MNHFLKSKDDPILQESVIFMITSLEPAIQDSKFEASVGFLKEFFRLLFENGYDLQLKKPTNVKLKKSFCKLIEDGA